MAILNRMNHLSSLVKTMPFLFNTLRPRQNGRRFADDTFKRIFLNENVRISIKISLKFVPKGPITNNSSLVRIMAWRRPGDKPLSETMMVILPTHICVTRPQWANIKPASKRSQLMSTLTLSTQQNYWGYIDHSYLENKLYLRCIQKLLFLTKLFVFLSCWYRCEIKPEPLVMVVHQG